MNEKKRAAKRAMSDAKGRDQGTAKKAKKRDGKSIRWMVTALVIAVAFLGWAVAAAGYASDVEDWSRPDNPVGSGRSAAVRGGIALFVVGLARVLWNSIAQLPNAHRVAWYTITEHPVILIVTVLFAAGVCLFGWWMSKLERQLAKQDKRFRRVSEND
jgi:flagellar basal body-associated protein FliL